MFPDHIDHDPNHDDTDWEDWDPFTVLTNPLRCHNFAITTEGIHQCILLDNTGHRYHLDGTGHLW